MGQPVPGRMGTVVERSQKPAPGRDLEPADERRQQDILHLLLPGERVGEIAVRRLGKQVERARGLRVQIEQDDSTTRERQAGREVDGDGRLTRSTLNVCNRV